MVDKSEKFRWLVRLGFAARGLVYLLIGYLALTAARAEGPEGAFDLLQDSAIGVPLLYAAAVGLVAYSVYRLCSLIFDVENLGTQGKGVAHRISHGASGVAHLALAWTAFKFAQGEKQTATDTGAQEAAGTLLSFPFGSLGLGVIGIGFLIGAAMQAKSAYSGNVMKGLAADAPAIVKPIGRAGYAARAVVFLIIGWSLMKSAWFDSSAQVKSLGDAVGSLSGQGLLYTLVAIGLVLFGIFSLFLARYRVVQDLDRSNFRPSLH